MATSKVTFDTADLSEEDMIKVAKVASEVMTLFLGRGSISIEVIRAESKNFYKSQENDEGQGYDGPGIFYKAIFAQSGSPKGTEEVSYHSRKYMEPRTVALHLAREIVGKKLNYLQLEARKMAIRLAAEVTDFKSVFERPGMYPGNGVVSAIKYLGDATTHAIEVLEVTKPSS